LVGGAIESEVVYGELVKVRWLAPLDVDVVRCWSTLLPFRLGTFGPVISRHEELNPADLARMLSLGGYVVTQQVGDNWRELKRFFPRAPDSSRLYQDYVDGFKTLQFPSDTWSFVNTPGRPDDDPIPNPYLFNTLDVNNDRSRDDHVLYGTGASTFNSAFDPLIGGTLLRNDRYFTPARAPIDPEVTGLLDITLPGEARH